MFLLIQILVYKLISLFYAFQFSSMSRTKVKAPQKLTATQPVSKKTAQPEVKSTGMMTWLILLSLALPVLYSDTTLDPVIPIRYLLLCAFLVAFTIYFFVIRKTAVPFSLPPLAKILLLTGLTYCLWNLVALYSAINPKESVFETSRTFANLFFLLIVSLAVYKERNRVLGLCKALVVMALVQSVVGILQYYDLGFTNLPGNFKPYGLMANRNLFGSAQVLLLPFGLYTLFAGKRIWKYVSAISLIALAFSILLSQTRAAWLAAGTIIVLSLVLVVCFSPQYRKKWVVGSLAGMAVIGTIGLLLFYTDKGGELSQSLKERSTSIAAILSKDTTSNMAVSTGNERLAVWNKTRQLINDHKFTGVGPANWKIGIQVYGNKGLLTEDGKNVLDRPHNVYLQIASETGLPGLLLFAGFLVLIGVIAFTTLKKVPTEDRILLILMLSGLAAFAADGFFSFPLERIEHTFYFILMAGIILGHYCLAYTATQPNLNPLRKWVAVPLLMGSVLLFISKAKYDFEGHFYKVRAYNEQKEFQNVVTEVEEGKSAVATMDQEGEPMVMYSSIAYKELKQYDKALEEIHKALKYHPYKTRIYSTMGTIYTGMQDFRKAISCYEKALSFTDRDEITLKNLAVNYYNVKEYAKCLDALNKIKSYDDEPVLLQIKQYATEQVAK
jgi:O-antigen ligase